jgi:hypothetical protein
LGGTVGPVMAVHNPDRSALTWPAGQAITHAFRCAARCWPPNGPGGGRGGRDGATVILRLARVIRCETVVSGTWNAAAICAVVSPHTVRSVSAICAGRGRAGWQQVKISQRRSLGSDRIGHCSWASFSR